MRVFRCWRLGVVATVATVALSVSLSLATEPASPYPECHRATTPADQEAAKGAHKAASTWYERGQYENAIRYWTDAYGFDCNAHGVLINIANAYEKSGNKRAAIVALETYLKRNGADATIEDKVTNLKASIAVAPTATAAPTAVPTATPPEAGPRPYGVLPWIVVGVGGAALVTGTILIPVGLGDISAAEKLCPLDPKKPGFRDCNTNTAAASQGTSGNAEKSAGIALLAVGGAALVGGLVWQFAFNKPGTASKAAAQLRILPAVGPKNSGLLVSGSF